MANEIRNRWAFLVGVNDYRESSRFGPLSHCVNDVLELTKRLKEVGYGTAICLHDDLGREDERFPDTANTVKAELRKLRDKVGPDDLLLVYFACHGTRNLSAGDTKPYLVLRDTRATLPETALSVADLKAEMQQFKAQRQVLILDACHMGMGQDERGDNTEESRRFIQNVHELATGFALLTPSTATQTTRESKVLQHGVFSHFVLEGLRGEGEALESTTEAEKRFVTVGSLSRYVTNKMLIWAADKGYEQLPQGAKEGGLGDFILVDYRQQALPEPVVAPLEEAASDARSFVVREEIALEPTSVKKTDTKQQTINWQSGKAQRFLREAILTVYSTRPRLAIFISDEFSQNLNSISNAGNLTDDVFNLIEYFKSAGELPQLYDVFCSLNVANPTIETLKQNLSSLD